MKILKIIHGYPPDYNAGSEVYSQSICNELKKRHEVTVFTREENLYAPDYKVRGENRDGLGFYFVNMAREKDGYNHKDVNQNFEEILSQLKPDIAHIGHLNHLSTGLVAELKKHNIPIVFTLHDFWLMCPRGQFLQVNFGNPNFHQVCDGQENRKCSVNCYNRYFSGIEENHSQEVLYWENWVEARMDSTRKITEDIDVFIAPSQYLRDRFILDFGIPPRNILYLDYGFPTHYLTPVERNRKDVFTFGYIGTHIPSKGVNMLIEAFAQIKHPSKLKIFGRNSGKSTSRLQKMAENSFNPIEFCGEYQNENIAQTVFAQVDCIVVPSIWTENSPLVIHEAQACEVPVITANIGGMKEYVHHLENGLLFEHRSIESLIEQFNFALKNPSLMRQLGKIGYLYTENHAVPNIAEHCQKLEEIYQSAINTKRNAST